MVGELADAGIAVEEASTIVQDAISAEYGAGPFEVPLSAVVVSARA
jgi:hypothetical protein